MMVEFRSGAAQTKSRYGPLPDGVYDLRILGAKTGTSKKGNPMATIAMIPMSSRYENEKVYYHVMLEDRFKPFSRSFFEALGLVDVGDLRNFDFSQLIGTKLRVVLRVEKKDAILRQRFVKFFPWKDKLPTFPVFSADFDDRDGVPITALIRYTKDGLIIRGFKFKSGVKVNEKIVRVRKMLLVLKRFLAHLEQEEISEE